MEAIDLTRSKLPPAHVLFGPAAFLGTMPSFPAHPNVRKLHGAGVAMINRLAQVAAMRVTDLKVRATENYDPALDEPARATLEAARETVLALTGTRAMIFERTLSRFVPHLAPEYLRLKDRAIKRLNEVRATIAFFLGATDDEELGYQFVPPPPPVGAASASVSLDLG